MAGRIIEPWFKGAASTDRPEDYLKQLDERLLELERVLGEWYQSLQFGPVPGAYLSWDFFWSSDLGFTSLSGILDVLDVVALPEFDSANQFQMRPIFVSAFLNNNLAIGPHDATLNLSFSGSSFTIINITTVGGLFSTNKSQDFNTQDIVTGVVPVNDVALSVVGPPIAGNPTHCHVKLICKAISRIEPTNP